MGLYIKGVQVIIFISDKFMFNGVHSDAMSVSLVTFDSNTFNPYGLNYNQSVSLQSTKNGVSYFTYDSEEVEEIELNLVLNDRNSNPLPWDDDTIRNVSDWLLTDSFAEFISEDNVDLIYYFKVKKIIKHLTNDRLGYLQLIIQPYSNFAYVKYHRKFIFDKKKENIIDIYNESSLKEEYKPVLKIKNLGDELDIIQVFNETTNKDPFVLSGLEKNEEVVIDGLIGTVYNQHKDNLIMKTNRRWFDLAKGVNKVKITGNIEITIMCKFPVRL